MKKLFLGIFLSGLMLFAFSFAAAQMNAPNNCYMRVNLAETVFNDLGCPSDGTIPILCNYDQPYPCGVCCLVAAVIYITNWIFTILVFLVVIFVLLGAYFILTSGADPGKVKKGRDYILYAAIGLAVALLSKAVPHLVYFMITGTVP